MNVEAYDYYLRGRQYFHQWRRKAMEHARQMFNRAIEIDPDYAIAYAGVADCCSFLYTYWDARESNLRQAEIASKKALELEPDLAEAHLSRGIALSLTKQSAAAEQEFETAMRLDPKLFEAPYFFARALKAEGRNADAAKMFERATLLRPEDFLGPNFLSSVYGGLGMTAESEAMRRRTIKLIEERLTLNPGDTRATALGAGIYARMGDRESANALAKRSLDIDPEDSMLLYNVACTYSLLGMGEEALGCLQRAVDNGFGHKEWIEHDNDFDPIREMPRFKSIVQAM